MTEEHKLQHDIRYYTSQAGEWPFGSPKYVEYLEKAEEARKSLHKLLHKKINDKRYKEVSEILFG